MRCGSELLGTGCFKNTAYAVVVNGEPQRKLCGFFLVRVLSRKYILYVAASGHGAEIIGRR